jgi:hypothetical protein
MMAINATALLKDASGRDCGSDVGRIAHPRLAIAFHAWCKPDVTVSVIWIS